MALIKTLYHENDSFRDRDLIRITQCRIASKFSDAETFTQHTSFYLPSYVTDMNYITHRRFSSTFINRSIDILLEF